MDYGESECERVTEREILYYKRPIQSNRIQVKTTSDWMKATVLR